ncbi:MAG: P-type DNA transfer ATPase VirB11, partial [Actinobacteria bacterium]|nr:P-type DNA transfer ATPase VirB11 [Actinomycetota bacterium]
MSADIHPFQPDGQTGEDAPNVDLHGERSVYLDAYLAPFREWLDRDTVTEILVNRPGEVWVEDAAAGGMQKLARPDIDDRLIQRLAEQ